MNLHILFSAFLIRSHCLAATRRTKLQNETIWYRIHILKQGIFLFSSRHRWWGDDKVRVFIVCARNLSVVGRFNTFEITFQKCPFYDERPSWLSSATLFLTQFFFPNFIYNSKLILANFIRCSVIMISLFMLGRGRMNWWPGFDEVNFKYRKLKIH